MAKLLKHTDSVAINKQKDLTTAVEAKRLIEEKIKSLQDEIKKITNEECKAVEGRRAKLVYSDIAWTKQTMLIHENAKEIAWHMVVVRRGDDEYYVEDLLDVYPQTVTGSTVVTDPTRYAFWVNDIPDEVWKHVRGQAHSHVYMATSPSSTDTQQQKETIQNIEDFYFFGIFNKRDDNWLAILDIENNIAFETKDIDLVVEYDEGGVQDFLQKAKDALVETSNTPKQKDKGNITDITTHEKSNLPNKAKDVITPNIEDNDYYRLWKESQKE